LAGQSDAADYDAVLAATMATECGRRFLAEFASRNRNADTAMVVGAIARVEAAIRGEAAPQDAPSVAAAAAAGELIEIAAAIDRIEAALAAVAPRASDTAAAIERMQDIAFTLHERPLEATLRDSFDAAVRELVAAAARPDAAADATDLLYALASRVREMIDARMSHQPAAEAFAVSPDGGEALARAVAAFAATLPVLAEAPETASAVPSEALPAPSDEAETSQPTPAEPPHAEAAAPVAESAPADETVAPTPVTELPAVEAKPAENAAAPAQQTASEILDSAAILSEAFSDDHFSSPVAGANEALASQVQPSAQASREEPPSEEPPRAEPPSEAALPAQQVLAERIADPEEDPADLFAPEPLPPPATPPVEAAAPVAAEAPLPEPPQVVPPPPMRAIPRPPLSDPLAAVRELSEEELIALFS
jgi:hypothetical protein